MTVRNYRKKPTFYKLIIIYIMKQPNIWHGLEEFKCCEEFTCGERKEVSFIRVLVTFFYLSGTALKA